jgi:hypothetical protein
MRTDNNDPRKRYKDFSDWLSDDWHMIFVLAPLLGYAYYLNTTTEG